MRKDGSRAWIAWTNRPIFDSAGKLVEVLCVGNDITHLKEAEREMLRALTTDEEYEAARASTPNAHYTSPEVIRGNFTEVNMQLQAAELPLNDSPSPMPPLSDVARRKIEQHVDNMLDAG